MTDKHIAFYYIDVQKKEHFSSVFGGLLNLFLLSLQRMKTTQCMGMMGCHANSTYVAMVSVSSMTSADSSELKKQMILNDEVRDVGCSESFLRELLHGKQSSTFAETSSVCRDLRL